MSGFCSPLHSGDFTLLGDGLSQKWAKWYLGFGRIKNSPKPKPLLFNWAKLYHYYHNCGMTLYKLLFNKYDTYCQTYMLLFIYNVQICINHARNLRNK